MTILKQYARRSLAGELPEYDDPFTYRSISAHTRAEVIAIVGEVMQGSSSRDLGSDPAAELDGLVAFADIAYDPRYWMIAYRDDRPIGLVFAQRYHDKPEEGSLFLVGVLPEHRGRGYARVLHAHGLRMLRAAGCDDYVGSTDVDNLAMIAVFVANGCRLTAVRDVEV